MDVLVLELSRNYNSHATFISSDKCSKLRNQNYSPNTSGISVLKSEPQELSYNAVATCLPGTRK